MAEPDETTNGPEAEQSGVPAETKRWLSKWVRRRGRRIAALNLVVLLLVSLVSAYQGDVRRNIDRKNSSEISVNVRYPEPSVDALDDATIYFDGFGTYDADHLSSTLAPAVTQLVDGEVWSVSYGNAPLVTSRIGDLVIELAEERGTEQLDLVGYSMGGIVALEVASHVARHSDIDVRSLLFVSTPSGFDGLRPHQRQELAFAESFSRIPGAQYSTAVRYIGEVYFMRNRFSEGTFSERTKNFATTLGTARQFVNRPKLPGTWLLVDQAFTIGSANVEREFERIAGAREEKGPLPSVLYLGTAPPGRDYMVNDDVSSQQICAAARGSGINCHIRKVPGAVHTMPQRTVEEYTEAFAAARHTMYWSFARANARFAQSLFENERERFTVQLENLEESGNAEELNDEGSDAPIGEEESDDAADDARSSMNRLSEDAARELD